MEVMSERQRDTFIKSVVQGISVCGDDQQVRMNLNLVLLHLLGNSTASNMSSIASNSAEDENSMQAFKQDMKGPCEEGKSFECSSERQQEKAPSMSIENASSNSQPAKCDREICKMVVQNLAYEMMQVEQQERRAERVLYTIEELFNTK